MVLLGLGIWLLYVIFKQFMKSPSFGGKIGWTILGLFVLGIALSNIYSIIGIAAAYVLYVIFKQWKQDDSVVIDENNNDPFKNFERQWAELNR